MRSAIGWSLPAIAVIPLAYGLFGNQRTGAFGYPGLPLDSFLGTIAVAEGGLRGSLTGVSVNIIAVFVIMGAVEAVASSGGQIMPPLTGAGREKLPLAVCGHDADSRYNG